MGKTDVATYTSDTNLVQRQTWTLDDLGNWAVNELQQDSVSVAQAATANMADEYTTIDFDGPGGDDPVELAHDHNGNLKDDGTYLYDYDIENRMTRVRLRDGGDTIAVYQYDAMGRRIRKTITNLGSGTDGTFEFVNSPEWQVLEWHRTAGTGVIFDVTYVHAGQSAYIDDHVALANGTDPWGFYHTDAQYNTLTTTNSIGDVGQRFLLDPYGHFVTYDANWTSVSLAPPVGLQFVHQGLVFDGEAGKYQNRRREYLLTLGRFAQRGIVRADQALAEQHIYGNIARPVCELTYGARNCAPTRNLDALGILPTRPTQSESGVSTSFSDVTSKCPEGYSLCYCVYKCDNGIEAASSKCCPKGFGPDCSCREWIPCGVGKPPAPRCLRSSPALF